MLRDYFKSFTFVAVFLLGYSVIVVTHKKTPNPKTDARLETARASVPVSLPNGATEATSAPAADFND